MDIYRAMMNQGFIIFEYGPKFVLDKSSTPASQMPMSGTEEFDSFEDALERVKEMISWKEPEQQKTASVQTVSTTWKMQMMYRHKGMGTKFIDLGELGTTNYEVAVAEANNRAEAYIIKNDIEKDVVSFEVRVRPCQQA